MTRKITHETLSVLSRRAEIARIGFYKAESRLEKAEKKLISMAQKKEAQEKKAKR